MLLPLFYKKKTCHYNINLPYIISTLNYIQAPAVPKRTTSMQTQNANANSNANNITVARMVIDLEMKFANYFHKANDFPAPPPYQRTTKTYPSQSSKNVAKGKQMFSL